MVLMISRKRIEVSIFTVPGATSRQCSALVVGQSMRERCVLLAQDSLICFPRLFQEGSNLQVADGRLAGFHQEQ